MTDQTTTLTPEDLTQLKEDLLRIRSIADALRLSGINDEADKFAGKQKTVDAFWEELQSWELHLQKTDPLDTLKIRAFIMSAFLAVSAAEHMYARWESLSKHAQQAFDDEGHKRLIEKHMTNSRRRFTDLAREAREATHIAYFLLARPEVSHVKPA